MAKAARLKEGTNRRAMAPRRPRVGLTARAPVVAEQVREVREVEPDVVG